MKRYLTLALFTTCLVFTPTHALATGAIRGHCDGHWVRKDSAHRIDVKYWWPNVPPVIEGKAWNEYRLAGWMVYKYCPNGEPNGGDDAFIPLNWKFCMTALDWNVGNGNPDEWKPFRKVTWQPYISTAHGVIDMRPQRTLKHIPPMPTISTFCDAAYVPVNKRYWYKFSDERPLWAEIVDGWNYNEERTKDVVVKSWTVSKFLYASDPKA